MPPRFDRRDYTDAFVVSLKRDAPDLPAIRGHVDEIATGSRHYFTSIDGLVTFFRSFADTTARMRSDEE